MNMSGGSIANGTQILGYTYSSSSVNEKWRGYYTRGTTFLLATELSSIGAAVETVPMTSSGPGSGIPRSYSRAVIAAAPTTGNS